MSEVNPPDIPNEEELHTFVEGELSALEEQALLRRLGGQDKALRGLELLRADRERLQRTTDPEPPEGLIADCLLQVERDQLISEDPMAPPIQFTTPRQRRHLNRVAAAAVFILFVGVGGVLIFKNVLVVPDSLRFGDETAWEKEEAEEAARLLVSRNNEENQSEEFGTSAEVTELAGLKPTHQSESTLVANSGAAVANPVESPQTGNQVATNLGAGESSADLDKEINPPVTSPERIAVNPQLSDTLPMSVADAARLAEPTAAALSADVGLVVRLTSLDRTSALARLRALVNHPAAGTVLIYNAPPIDRLPSPHGFDLDSDPARWLTNTLNDTGNAPGMDDGDGDGVGGAGVGGGANILSTRKRTKIPVSQQSEENDSRRAMISTADQLRLVPRSEQYAYRAANYEYTLVGTAPQLQAILQEMNDGSDVSRVRVLRRNADGSTTTTALLDLLPPARPAPAEWTRALCWWNNPERNLELAQRLVKAYQPQPIIRIPLRIVGN